MYLPRDLFSRLYQQLQRRWHAQQSPVVLLVALEPDALCACRILTALLKRDYILHNIIPVAGYNDLARAGEENVQPMRMQNGGLGGTVICLGVGGLVDLASVLGLDPDHDSDDATGGVEIWVIDARRPWNLNNIFSGKPPDAPLEAISGNARSRAPDVSLGRIQPTYHAGRGGIIVFDDGDISDQLEKERDAYFRLEELPAVEEGEDSGNASDSGSDDEISQPQDPQTKKRKSLSDSDAEHEDDDDENEDRPRQRRRTNSSSSINVPTERPARHGLMSTSAAVVPSSFPSRSPSPANEPTSYQARPESMRKKRRRILRMKAECEDVLYSYYASGTSYSEPISSIMYSLVSDLGREDNNMLWNAIVGVSSLELYGRTMSGVSISDASESGGSAGWGGDRGEAIRQVLRDEVRRLNPSDATDGGRSEAARGSEAGIIPTTARSPNDHSIRLSPEPRFLLIRHWSLYDSMLHSPYLASRLHMWTEQGRRRLDKLLAKMGVSLSQSKQSYTHMDMDLKKDLRQRLLKYAPAYGLDGLVPPPPSAGRGREGWGFVRSWGWKACLSAVDVGVILGAILEVGKGGLHLSAGLSERDSQSGGQPDGRELVDENGRREGEEYVSRFYDAYDALDNVQALLKALPSTQHLHRAIHRTGTALLSKRQIRHLRAFRMGVVKDGPDVQLFTHPGALTKLALWLGEALAQQEKESHTGKPMTPLVLAGLNESRGVYIVVGTGGGGGVLDGGVARREREERAKEQEKKKEAKAAEKQRKKDERAARRATRTEDNEDDEDDETEEEDDDSDNDEDFSTSTRGKGKNRFGQAFQEVIEETGARVRIDSFEHCVMEVRKDDLGRFLEALSQKAVVGL